MPPNRLSILLTFVIGPVVALGVALWAGAPQRRSQQALLDAADPCVVLNLNPQAELTVPFHPTAWPAWQRLKAAATEAGTSDGPVVMRYRDAPEEFAALIDVLLLSAALLPPECADQPIELLRVGLNDQPILKVVP